MLSFIEVDKNNLEIHAKIAAQSYQEHHSYIWYYEGKKHIKELYNKASILLELNNKSSKPWIINNNNNPICILKLYLTKRIKFFESSDFVVLERLYILINAVEKQIGSKALKFTLDFTIQKKTKYGWKQ